MGGDVFSLLFAELLLLSCNYGILTCHNTYRHTFAFIYKKEDKLYKFKTENVQNWVHIKDYAEVK
jgi:hypothetical protein